MRKILPIYCFFSISDLKKENMYEHCRVFPFIPRRNEKKIFFFAFLFFLHRYEVAEKKDIFMIRWYSYAKWISFVFKLNMETDLAGWDGEIGEKRNVYIKLFNENTFLMDTFVRFSQRMFSFPIENSYFSELLNFHNLRVSIQEVYYETALTRSLASTILGKLSNKSYFFAKLFMLFLYPVAMQDKQKFTQRKSGSKKQQQKPMI